MLLIKISFFLKEGNWTIVHTYISFNTRRIIRKDNGVTII